MKKIYCLFVLLSLSVSAQNKILFDATKAETAGNADWVIDSDLFNITYSGGPASIGGNESNPQRIPTPAQSGIAASTVESYWKGALSAWAVDCVKKGYTVETLPYNGQITFGNTSNVQDLINYKLFIVDEPNIDFTPAERTAIISFVNNGGSLFMISDHNISDRNGDGIDSPVILNNLMTLNSVQANPFGIIYDNNNISVLTSNVATTTVDPLLNGTYGNVIQMKYSNGSTMTINTAQNSSVKAVIFNTGSSTTGTANAMCAYATFGSGKVVAIGDSSVPDDGSGDTGDTLYDGYIADASGNHQKLLMNATVWLMTTTLANENFIVDNFNFTIAPNPIQNRQINLSYNLNLSENVSISIFDSLGRNVKESIYTNGFSGINYKTIDVSNLQSGIYICKITSEKGSKSLQIILE